MSIVTPETRKQNNKNDVRSLRFLNPRQVMMIDEALSKVGDFGEVRLIIEKGRLRFLTTQNSYDVLKWHPGETVDQDW
jgi:hypothetical protein